MGVTLRSRKISGGRLSWIADIQPTPIIDNAPKRFWTLDIYTIENPKTAQEKAQNAELMKRAEAARSRLHLMMIDGKLPGKSTGVTVAQAMTDMGERYTKIGTKLCWVAARKHCDKAGIGKIILSNLSPAQCVTFRAYLLNSGLGLSSASTYLAKFRAMLRQAKRAGVVVHDLRDSFDSIGFPAPRVGWLEQSDMDKLFSTATNSGCREPFIFACLTGLRYVDLASLEWPMIIDHQDGSSELQYRITKTKKASTLPISRQARDVLGARSTGKVFLKIPCKRGYNDALKRWARRAGLDMPTISSHKARHTAAVLALDGGVPIEIIRDMLGHSSVTQTEVYAKVRAERVKQYAGVVKTSVDVSMMPKLRRVK
jgi:integrase